MMKYKHNAGYSSVPQHLYLHFSSSSEKFSHSKTKSLKSQHIFVKFDHAAHFSSFTEFYLVTKLALPMDIKDTLHYS